MSDLERMANTQARKKIAALEATVSLLQSEKAALYNELAATNEWKAYMARRIHELETRLAATAANS